MSRLEFLSSIDAFNQEECASQLSSLDDLQSLTVQPSAPKFKIRKMYFAALSALFLALTLGLISGYSAPATYDLSHDPRSRIKPTENEISWIGSIVGLGFALGGLIAGPTADIIGRKDTLIFNIIPTGLGWLLICHAVNAEMIIIGRFFTGFSCGFTVVTVPMYCVEISTADVRGVLGSGFQGFLVIGNLLSVVIGSVISWDYLALHAAILSIFGVICFCFVPESPLWLLSKGRLKEAVFVMNKLQGDFVDAETVCNEISKKDESRPEGRITFKEFMHPTVYKPALLGCAIFFFQQFSGANAVFFFSTEIFDISKDFLDPKKATIILAAVQVVATLFSNFIVDKTGRRILLILSGAIMSANITVLGIYYYKSSNDTEFQNTYSWIPLLTLILFVVGFSTGYGPIPSLLCNELLPTKARSTVSGFVSFLNAMTAFVVTKTFSDLQYYLKSYGTFWLYGICSLVSISFVIFVLPETKGKTLEEIEAMFDTEKKQRQKTIDVAVISH